MLPAMYKNKPLSHPKDIILKGCVFRMDRKKKLRRATTKEAQMKRVGAEEFAQEFPEGPLGAPPLENVKEQEHLRSKQKKTKE